jgi:transposase-like protein
MDPQGQFCHNPHCPARGQVGHGNIRVQSRKERRYRCTTCGRTFAVWFPLFVTPPGFSTS